MHMTIWCGRYMNPRKDNSFSCSAVKKLYHFRFLRTGEINNKLSARDCSGRVGNRRIYIFLSRHILLILNIISCHTLPHVGFSASLDNENVLLTVDEMQ